MIAQPAFIFGGQGLNKLGLAFGLMQVGSWTCVLHACQVGPTHSLVHCLSHMLHVHPISWQIFVLTYDVSGAGDFWAQPSTNKALRAPASDCSILSFCASR